MGEGVSEQSVVSECPSCSLTGMAVEDLLSDWEECSLREESGLRELVAWLCIRLLGYRKGCLYKQDDRPRAEGRRGGHQVVAVERSHCLVKKWAGEKHSQRGVKKRGLACASVRHLPPIHWQVSAGVQAKVEGKE